MGQAFDEARDDSSFCLPPDVFNNPTFKRGLSMFLSPDGKSARMTGHPDTDPATPQGISYVDGIDRAVRQAIKGTPLAGSNIYLAGTASTFKDIQYGAKYDLLIAGIAALEPDPADHDVHHPQPGRRPLVIVGTVALSLGASFGLSVLVWEKIFGIDLYWIAGAGRDSAAGRRLGLQPAADIAVQGGDRRRAQHRHHPGHGVHRRGGDGCRAGVRRDHGLVRLLQPAGAPGRSGRRSGWACCSTPWWCGRS